MIQQALAVVLPSVSVIDIETETPVEVARQEKRFRARKPRTVTAEAMVPRALGDGRFTAGHQVGWAKRMLLRGYYVGRYGWCVDERPKRLYHYLEGGRLRLRYEDGLTEEFACLTWADVAAEDWYLVEQLEAVR